jgi:predicted amidohydrolase YtcJ
MSSEQRIVFANGPVLTQDPSFPLAQGVAVRKGRIAFVGSAVDAITAGGPGARIIDLGGRPLLPGFIDDHTHFVWGGRHLQGIDLRSCRSLQEFRERIGAFAARQPGNWILGGTWDQERWVEKRLPRREEIDAVTPATPVFVQRLDGHMGLANSVALRLSGITAATPDPEGGAIVRDPATGEPTGILKDTAMELVSAVVPAPSAAVLDEAVRLAMAEARRQGITSIHDITLPEQYAAFRRLEENRELTVRIYTRLPIAEMEQLIAEGIRAGSGSPWLKRGSLKAFADGSLGSNTAWFFDPYLNDPASTGLPMDIVTSGELRARALQADRAGLQLSIHAIGDRANDYVLGIFEEIVRTNPRWDRRLRIEHAQHVRPVDFDRFARLGVFVSAQPYHLVDDGPWAGSRIGPVREATTYAFRTFLDHGVRLGFGSDWTVAPLDVLAGIHAAVTRQTADGLNERGWIPEQKLTVEEALRAYTAENAYGAFEEGEKGMIATGFLADLVILDRDIRTIPADEICQAQVDLTMVDGRVVYER